MHVGLRSPQGCPIALTAGVLLLALSLVPPPAGPPSTPSLASVGELVPATVALTISPRAWWLVDGGSTDLSATWADPSPSCELTPIWFHWSLPGGGPEGVLDSLNGSAARFTAGAGDPGVTAVEVRAVAALDCGNRSSLIVASAGANMTSVPPLLIEGFSVGPNPAFPGSLTWLTASVVGGTPPYSYRVAWGDGSSTSGNLASAGALTLSHPFRAGWYSPTLTVVDSTGLVNESTAPTALDVGSGFSLGLDANASETDVGVPVTINATVLDPPLGSTASWWCPTAWGTQSLDSNLSVHFPCSFPGPGTDNVTLAVSTSPGSPGLAVAFPVNVQLPPVLTALSVNDTFEMGGPGGLAFDLAGGVAPFRLSWFESSTPVEGTESIATDGVVVVPLQWTRAGAFTVVAEVIDADGLAAWNVSNNIRVDPALNVSSSASHTLNASGATLAISGTVMTGAPPFFWDVVSESAPFNQSAHGGVLSSVGTFDWWGVFRSQADTTVYVVVTDGSGGVYSGSSVLQTLSPLEGRLAVAADGTPPPGNFELSLSVAGGLAPYWLEVNGSEGQEWNRTLGSACNGTWFFPAAVDGSLGLQIVLVDASGSALHWNVTVVVTPVSPSATGPPSDSYATGAAVVAALAFCALSVVLYLRRRTSSRERPKVPDPVPVLRRIIEPADGADRATVELLAEEEGVPIELARSTIDRLIHEGVLRREAASDGEEVISWSDLSSP